MVVIVEVLEGLVHEVEEGDAGLLVVGHEVCDWPEGSVWGVVDEVRNLRRVRTRVVVHLREAAAILA